MRVFVYYNLHKKIFSVKALEGSSKGKVISHSNDLVLENIEFKVSQAGRARVLREKQKNVHAGVSGTWREHDRYDAVYNPSMVAITYNPYKYSSFVLKDNEEPIFNAKLAVLKNRSIFATI